MANPHPATPPWFLVNLGMVGKGKNDCGDHEWYNHDGVTARCYHCEVGESPYSSAVQQPGRPVAP